MRLSRRPLRPLPAHRISARPQELCRQLRRRLDAATADAVSLLGEASRRTILVFHPRPLAKSVRIPFALRYNALEATMAHRSSPSPSSKRGDELHPLVLQIEILEERSPLRVTAASSWVAPRRPKCRRRTASEQPGHARTAPRAEPAKVRPAIGKHDELTVELDARRGRAGGIRGAGGSCPSRADCERGRARACRRGTGTRPASARTPTRAH